MLRFVYIHRDPPRTLKGFNATLAEGLGLSRYLSFFIKAADKAYLERERIYTNGKIVYATVKEQVKAGFFSNKLGLEVSIDSVSGKKVQKLLCSDMKDLWKKHPVGSKVVGIEHEGDFLFGQSMRCIFKVYEDEQE